MKKTTSTLIAVRCDQGDYYRRTEHKKEYMGTREEIRILIFCLYNLCNC